MIEIAIVALNKALEIDDEVNNPKVETENLEENTSEDFIL